MQAARARLFASPIAERVTSVCLARFGGYGCAKDSPVEKFYRDATIGAIDEGTSNRPPQTVG